MKRLKKIKILQNLSLKVEKKYNNSCLLLERDLKIYTEKRIGIKYDKKHRKQSQILIKSRRTW